MRKIMMIFIVLSLVFSGSLMAEGLGLGLTTGINMSKFVGDDAEEFLEGIDAKFKTGFAFGGFLTIPIGRLDGRVEALFSQNGSKYEGKEDGTNASIKFNLNSLSIPITASLNILPSLRVFAGPYFDIFLSGKTMLELSYEGVSFDEDEDIESDDVTTVAMGIIVGAAYSIFDNLEFELRMNRGLNSLDATDDELDFKPNVISGRVNLYIIR